MTDYSNENHSNQNISKKRVLFVITQSEMGGAQRFLYEIVSRLNKNDYEIKVLTGRDGGKEFFDRSKDEAKIDTEYIETLKRNINIKSDLKATQSLRRIINEFRPDILFLNSSKAGFIGALAARFPVRFKNLHVIYRIGGWSFNDPWPRWKKFLWFLLEYLTAPLKDIIIVNNKHDFDQARKLKIRPREKLELIYNGINEYDLFDRIDARNRLNQREEVGNKIDENEFLIGTVANFYPTKGLKYLIEAMKDINNKLVIIGDGQEKTNIENLINDYGFNERIILVGQLEDARRFLKAFDVFVLPSVKEGFPWVVLEAMIAGVPVVATRVGAIPEIIENEKNGLIVEPRNPHLLASAIKKLLDNHDLRNKLSEAAYQTTISKFSLSKMVSKIESML